MTQISWKTAIDGNWYQQKYWDLNRPPQAGDDVVIGLSGTYTAAVVPRPGHEGDTLTVSSLTVSNAQATTNMSTYSVAVIGVLSNAGVMSIIGTELHTDDIINSGSLTLNGNAPVSGQLHNTGTLIVNGQPLTINASIAPNSLNAGAIILIDAAIVYNPGGSGITSIGGGAQLIMSGGGAGITDGNGHPINNELVNLGSNAGYLSFGNGAVVTNQGVAFNNSGTYLAFNGVASGTDAGINFTNSGTIDIDSGSSQGGSTLNVGGTLTNSGTLQVGNSDDSLSSNSTVTVAHLANTGTIDLYGQNGPNFQATLIDTGDAAPGQLASGVFVNLSGDALLQYASGSITSIASGSGLSLDGANARVADHGKIGKNSALVGLDNNAGHLTLGNGVAIANAALAFDNSGTYTIFNHVAVKTNLDFTNSGHLNLDPYAGEGGSSVKIIGALHNSGTLDVGNSSLTSPDRVTAASLDNTGTIVLVGNSASNSATLNIKGVATNTGTVDIETFGAVARVSIYSQTAGETDVIGSLVASRVLVTGGLLQGTGTITGNVNASGGDLAAGSLSHNTVGTLAVTGKFIDSSFVDAVIVAAGSGEASVINVSGTKVSLKGATLHLDITDPENLIVGEAFTIMHFVPGTLTNGFSAMKYGAATGSGSTIDLGNGLSIDAMYDNGAGTITLMVVTTPAAATAHADSFAYGGVASSVSGTISADGAIFYPDDLHPFSGVDGALLTLSAPTEFEGTYHHEAHVHVLDHDLFC